MDFHHIRVSAVRRRLVINELRLEPSPRGARLPAMSESSSIPFYKDDIVVVVVALSVEHVEESWDGPWCYSGKLSSIVSLGPICSIR